MGDQVARTLISIRPIGWTIGILLPGKTKHQQSELSCVPFLLS